MDWVIVGTIIGISLIVLITTGLPIAFSLGLLSTVGIYLMLEPQVLYMLGQTAFSTPSHFILIAVPLFILMAEVLSSGELSHGLFEAARNWIGKWPGGLASASVLACAAFASLTGSSTANTAAMGSICTPEMLKRGYDKGLATGSVCAAGALGILIPPSILMVIYGALTETSIASLFIAGVIPGIILAAGHILDITVRCIIKPSLAPPAPGVTWAVRWESTRKTWWVVVLLILIIGGIYSGAATPTEAAALGALGAIILSVTLSKTLTWPKFEVALLKTVMITSMVLFIMIGAMIFGVFLTHLGIPQQLVNWILELSVNRWFVMIGINLLYIVMGCFLDAGSIILITVPILFPIVKGLGFDPVWFGIVMVLNMEISNITPPLGLNLFVMKGIVSREVSYLEIIRGIVPFIFVQLAVLILVMVFPQLAIWLPNTMR